MNITGIANSYLPDRSYKEEKIRDLVKYLADDLIAAEEVEKKPILSFYYHLAMRILAMKPILYQEISS